MADRPALVLIGPPAAGKTKVGRRVAETLSLRFVDTDRLIVAAHGPIGPLFLERGEPAFRRLERAEVVTALNGDGIVALGGGAILDPDTRRDLAAHRVGLITVSAGAVAARLLMDGKRPLLTGGLSSWTALVKERAPLYTALASRTFDSSNRPIDRVAADVADWLVGEGV